MITRKLQQRKLFSLIVIVFMFAFNSNVFSSDTVLNQLQRLLEVYPNQIQSFNNEFIFWHDGSKIPIYNVKLNNTIHEKLNNPSLADQLTQTSYPIGNVVSTTHDDPGRIRHEPFFRKMYGNSASEVRRKLVTIYWMPKIFGSQYALLVTTVNAVDKKLIRISQELERLVLSHPEYRKFIESPGGTFNWRYIANTTRLSPHSFGITIDINTKYSNYWQWDLQSKGLPVNEATPIVHRNQIPWEIVSIFEKYHFIWGGKWYHYDTMHFEYRPEMFD